MLLYPHNWGQKGGKSATSSSVGFQEGGSFEIIRIFILTQEDANMFNTIVSG